MSRYQDVGVDVNAGYELVHRIKDAVKSTDRPGVIGGIGSFGGMFDLEKFSNIKIAKELNVDEASIRRAKKRYNL